MIIYLFMIFILGTACIEKLCFSIHDYCLFTNKKGIHNIVINNKFDTFTINKDIYYEFIFHSIGTNGCKLNSRLGFETLSTEMFK